MSASPSVVKTLVYLSLAWSAHFLDGDQANLIPNRCAKPCQPARRCRIARERRQHARQRVEGALEFVGGWWRAQALAQASNRLREPIVGGGLEQVIDGFALEGFECVLVVGGHEDDLHTIGDTACYLDPVETGHADVQKQHVGVVLLDQLERLGSIAGDADDVELRYAAPSLSRK
jgi:hypothetical protein